MKMRFVFILSLFLLLFAPLFSISAQSTERTKPKVKNFGKSLEKPFEENLKRKKNSTGNAYDEDNIVIETNLVVFDFLVTDKQGTVIEGLTKEDFVVTEDGQPQEIQTFTVGNDANISRSIVLIIDYSGSQFPYIERSVEAAKLLVEKLRPNDLMAVVTDDVEIISQFTNDKKSLKKVLDSLKAQAKSRHFGKSKQFSSLYAVLNEMFSADDIRPIIIFQTDGDELLFLKGEYGPQIFPSPYLEFSDNFSFNDLITMTEKTRATIYSVYPGISLFGLSDAEKAQKLETERINFLKAMGINPAKIKPPTKEMIENEKALNQKIKYFYPNGVPNSQEKLKILSEKTGGWIEFLESPDQADRIFSRILSEINTRYIIGYSPTNEMKDGKRRSVKISLKSHPDYTVWGRKFYLAPMPD